MSEDVVRPALAGVETRSASSADRLAASIPLVLGKRKFARCRNGGKHPTETQEPCPLSNDRQRANCEFA